MKRRRIYKKEEVKLATENERLETIIDDVSFEDVNEDLPCAGRR